MPVLLVDRSTPDASRVGVVRDLARGFRVIVPDLALPPETADEHAGRTADARAWQRSWTETGSVVVGGVSAESAGVAEFYRSQPERVRALVLPGIPRGRPATIYLRERSGPRRPRRW